MAVEQISFISRFRAQCLRGVLVPFWWLAVVYLARNSELWGVLVPLWWLAVVYLARNSELGTAHGGAQSVNRDRELQKARRPTRGRESFRAGSSPTNKLNRSLSRLQQTVRTHKVRADPLSFEEGGWEKERWKWLARVVARAGEERKDRGRGRGETSGNEISNRLPCEDRDPSRTWRSIEPVYHA